MGVRCPNNPENSLSSDLEITQIILRILLIHMMIVMMMDTDRLGE